MNNKTKTKLKSEPKQRGVVISWEERRDILDSDARQRAEICRLKAEVVRWRDTAGDDHSECGHTNGTSEHCIFAPLAPKRGKR